jgi:LacI family transcriptional regulator
MALKDPTVYDVAREAGVSITTVSRVLNSPSLVRESTRTRVLDAIDKLGFVPKADARERARKQLGRIGILTPFFTFPSFVQRMRGIAEYLADKPYELVIYPVDSFARLDGYLSMLPITRRLDGLIVITLPVSDTAAQRLIENGLQTILVEYHHPSFSSIEIDDVAGGKLAAEYLLSKGHTRCAFLESGELPEYTLRPEDRRLTGFRQALADAGIPLPDEYICKLPILSAGQDCDLTALFNQPDPPTALFAATDDLAIRALRFAREHGINIPNDLAIIGFDDIDMAEYIGLTTVKQSLDDSGKMAVELLLGRLENPNRPIQHVKIQLEVVERQTA